jgi:hypothetical protein
MSFYAVVEFAFRNTETNRKSNLKLKEKEISDILAVFATNYQIKENIGDIIEFQMSYKGTEGSAKFAIHGMLDVADTHDEFYGFTPEKRQKIYLEQLPNVLTGEKNTPLTFINNAKTFQIETVKIEINELNSNESDHDIDESINTTDTKTTTEIVIPEKDKENKKKVKKGKKEIVEKIAEQESNEEDELLQVNKLAEKVNRKSVPKPKLTESDEKYLETKKQSKEILRQQKELEKQAKAAEKKAALAEEKKIKADERKAERLKTKQAEKDEIESIVVQISNLTIQSRIDRLNDMKRDILASNKDESVISKELIKIAKIEIAVEKSIKQQTDTKRKKMIQLFKKVGEYYKHYNSLKLFIGKLANKIPQTIPAEENSQPNENTAKLILFSTTLTSAYENYINFITDSTGNYEKDNVEKDTQSIILINQLINDNSDTWFQNSKTFKDGTKIKSLLHKFSYWLDEDEETIESQTNDDSAGSSDDE